jgi:Flp pilus assembly protein protease CpaA
MDVISEHFKNTVLISLLKAIFAQYSDLRKKDIVNRILCVVF